MEYSLTKLGQDLHPVIHLLNVWGKEVQEANGLEADKLTAICKED